MDKITSADGTPIAYARSGGGPPLILVHGTAATSTRWAPIIPALAEHFTVYAVDRRGRGESGDAEDYAVEREFEDVAAVIDATGEPANVLGHSFGGLCAVEAGLRTRNMRRLILYEPALPQPDEKVVPEGVISRLQELLDAGDREAVVTTFMLEVVRMEPDEFAAYRTRPAWPARVAAAHTLVRELLLEEMYRFDAARFAGFRIPTLILSGGDSPVFMRKSCEVVDAALPDSRIVVLPGQRHIAMDTAPELFVREVLAFLLGPG